MTTIYKKYEPHFKGLDSHGTFDALVSVFGNVDIQGDVVMPGAFKKSIEKWKASGDPLPVIFSHDWQNPFAHIGYVTSMRESTMGLEVEGKLDVDTNEFAAQVYTLLKDRRVREWSFGYDVIKELPRADRATELLELDIIEVGPTLKGANELTMTLGVKGAKPGTSLTKVREDLSAKYDKAIVAEVFRDSPEDRAARVKARRMKVAKERVEEGAAALTFIGPTPMPRLDLNLRVVEDELDDAREKELARLEAEKYAQREAEREREAEERARADAARPLERVEWAR